MIATTHRRNPVTSPFPKAWSPIAIPSLPARTLRVFPRRTKGTPTDHLARVGPPQFPLFEDAQEIHISVAFDVDKPLAEDLARQWAIVTRNVKVGGPAYGDPGGAFTPGMYLHEGFTITSRGCPNRCWFCRAWKSEGNTVRTYPIYPGYIVQDNNLLACPRPHVEAVFDMLSQQTQPPRFTGGLDPSLLQPWHAAALAMLKPLSLWLAYDTPDDWEPVQRAARMLRDVELLHPRRKNRVGSYVLIGYPRDTFEDAQRRLDRVLSLGLRTHAPVYDNGAHLPPDERAAWKRLSRQYSNPRLVYARLAELHAQ
jgi:hypothetical protein